MTQFRALLTVVERELVRRVVNERAELVRFQQWHHRCRYDRK